MMCRRAPLHSSGYGHMADGIRPEPAVYRTACSWVSDGPPSSVKSPPGPGRSLVARRFGPRRPRDPRGSRENPADIGVALDDHAGHGLICDVPAVDHLCTLRDGTDDGDELNGTRYLLRSPDDAAGVGRASYAHG